MKKKFFYKLRAPNLGEHSDLTIKRVLDNKENLVNLLLHIRYMILRGHFKYGENMRRRATIMRMERMMNRSTERIVSRMTMKTREGWGLSLAPKI